MHIMVHQFEVHCWLSRSRLCKQSAAGRRRTTCDILGNLFCSGTPLNRAVLQGKYLRNAGVQALSYGETASPIAGGDSIAGLVRELGQSKAKHNAAGLVSLQVEPSEEMCAHQHLYLTCLHMWCCRHTLRQYDTT